MQKINKFLFLTLLLLCAINSKGQTEKLDIQINTAYDNWLAKPGDQVSFDIQVNAGGASFP